MRITPHTLQFLLIFVFIYQIRFLSLRRLGTIGSIALQGIRRAKPTIGETFVVLGLGIVGQLTVQMLSLMAA